MTFKDMTLYFFFYLGIVTFVDSTSRMNKLIVMWLGVHGLLAINGMLHQGRGVGGWLGDENDFGMEMNVAVPVAFFMYQAAKNKRVQVSLPWLDGALCHVGGRYLVARRFPRFTCDRGILLVLFTSQDYVADPGCVSCRSCADRCPSGILG
jgi:ferredoxin